MARFKANIRQLCVVLLVTCLTSFAAAAQLQDPVDVHRAEWHARPPKADITTYQSYGLRYPPTYTTIVLHSTDSGYGVGEEEAQRIQNYEMNKMDFSDMGYNFLIDSEGTIFEGRELSYVPSHAGQTEEGNTEHDITKDPDWRAIGIAFSSGPKSPISDKQIRAAKKLIEFFVQHPRFEVAHVITHAEVAPLLKANQLTPVGGDYNPHVCPGGNNLEALVSLRSTLRQEFGIPFNETAFRNLFRFYVKPPQTTTRATITR